MSKLCAINQRCLSCAAHLKVIFLPSYRDSFTLLCLFAKTLDRTAAAVAQSSNLLRKSFLGCKFTAWAAPLSKCWHQQRAGNRWRFVEKSVRKSGGAHGKGLLFRPHDLFSQLWHSFSAYSSISSINGLAVKQLQHQSLLRLLYFHWFLLTIAAQSQELNLQLPLT